MDRTFISDVSRKKYPLSEKVSASSVRQSVLKLIQQDRPGFDENSSLSIQELNRYRKKYISEMVNTQLGDMTDLEKTVLTSITDDTILSDKIDADDDDSNLTFGQKIADKVATFGGSWTFIILFLLFILVWIAVNVFWLASRAVDPYPFILLNLLLSCLAALQAPVIMMSQNRQEDKDRDRAKKDYMVNLKSEIEIRGLHEKMDHSIIRQYQQLMEVQHIQMEMLQDILDQLEKKGHTPAKKEKK